MEDPGPGRGLLRSWGDRWRRARRGRSVHQIGRDVGLRRDRRGSQQGEGIELVSCLEWKGMHQEIEIREGMTSSSYEGLQGTEQVAISETRPLFSRKVRRTHRKSDKIAGARSEVAPEAQSTHGYARWKGLSGNAAALLLKLASAMTLKRSSNGPPLSLLRLAFLSGMVAAGGAKGYNSPALGEKSVNSVLPLRFGIPMHLLQTFAAPLLAAQAVNLAGALHAKDDIAQLHIGTMGDEGPWEAPSACETEKAKLAGKEAGCRCPWSGEWLGAGQELSPAGDGCRSSDSESSDLVSLSHSPSVWSLEGGFFQEERGYDSESIPSSRTSSRKSSLSDLGVACRMGRDWAPGDTSEGEESGSDASRRQQAPLVAGAESSGRPFEECHQGPLTEIECFAAIRMRRHLHRDQHYLSAAELQLAPWPDICFWHGSDKLHRPALFVKLGLAVRTLPRAKFADLGRVIVSQIEHAERHLFQEGTGLGERLCVIVDAEGLGLMRMAPTEALKPAFRTINRDYPGRQGFTFIINMPPLMMAFVGAIKRILNCDSDKVAIYGRGYKPILQALFEPDQLHHDYGGECRCCKPTGHGSPASDKEQFHDAVSDFRELWYARPEHLWTGEALAVSGG